MAATQSPKQRALRRSWSPAEKRRIVELTLRASVSVLAIAREHGVRPNSLHRWRALYRAGKLNAQALAAPRIVGPAASATREQRRSVVTEEQRSIRRNRRLRADGGHSPTGS